MPTARTIVITAHGGPEALTLVDRDVPAPGPGEVTIAQKAAGLNFIDVYQRTGLYPMKLPAALGMEGAGIVTAVGDGVAHLKIGSRVAYAANPPGAYAEARTMPAAQVCPLPDAHLVRRRGGDDAQGDDDAVPVPPHRAAWRRGDTVLFHAAAGGVGLIACQWAASEGITPDRHRRVGREMQAGAGKRGNPLHQLRDRGFSRACPGTDRAARASMW